jgi:hypothetical protein
LRDKGNWEDCVDGMDLRNVAFEPPAGLVQPRMRQRVCGGLSEAI